MERKSLIAGNSDFFFGIVIIVLSSVLWGVAKTITDAESAVVPIIVIVFMGIMGLGISVSAIRNRANNVSNSKKVSFAEIANGVLLPGAFLVGAYVLSYILGFYLAEFSMVVGLMFLQDKVTNGHIDRSCKRLLGVFVFSILVIAVMYLIFHFIFHLPTVTGIFNI